MPPTDNRQAPSLRTHALLPYLLIGLGLALWCLHEPTSAAP
ncbi:hypothetical protein [Xylophilus sp. GOD-11R]|nr:hypothetical protein [Xylophilus sp. GOD-11R]WPB57116.1 hypothetical protein R9X41_00165 [Xylophilus sp. GOD-11R]